MSGKKQYAIRFDGLKGAIECDENFRKNEAQQWQRYLKHARSNKATTVVTCLCISSQDKKIKRRLKIHLSQISDQCWLSSYKFTGHEHAPDCRFYSIWPDERHAEIYTSDVVTAAADGSLVVRLPTGLQKKDVSTNEPRATPKNVRLGKRRRQPSMQLLGLLHLLWERAGINVWHPAFDRRSRTPGWLSWKIQDTAAMIRIGRIPLQESLLLMANKGSQQAKDNWQRSRSAEKASRRLIFVSVLASWSERAEERLQYSLPLGLFSGFPELQLPDDVKERLNHSYSRQLGYWRKGGRVIVICETEPPETTFSRVNDRNVPSSSCKVIDIALMMVSPRYIPLDSSFEQLVEERLWEQKRAFTKPLRYDGEEDVFPDFVLTDIRGSDAVPMEVFGMSTHEYLLRKQAKTMHYDSEYGEGKWWHWNANIDRDGLQMPPFPER